MKSHFYKNSRKEQNEKNTQWDTFTSYLDSIYFPDASELLDTQLIAFEYEAFKQLFSD